MPIVEIMDTELINSLALAIFGEKPNTIERLKGDASARRIYRIKFQNESRIAVRGNNRAENDAFVSFTKIFTSLLLPVPHLTVYDPQAGVYFLEDLGDTLLSDEIGGFAPGSGDTIVSIYKGIIDHLIRFQVDAASKMDYSVCYQYAEFDRRNIIWDLLYFRYRLVPIFVAKNYDYSPLLSEFFQLADMLDSFERNYFMYRDFQSRNIIVNAGRYYFIDYQSGRRGALQYDLASLLMDPNVALAREIQIELLEYYLDKMRSLVSDRKAFQQGYYGFALARLLQALGAFGYLAINQGRLEYLKGLTPSLNNLAAILGEKQLPIKFPALSFLVHHLEDCTIDNAFTTLKNGK